MGAMVALRLLSVFFVLFVLAAQQVGAGGASSEEKVSVSYDGVFGATPVKTDVGLLWTTLASYRTTVREYSFSPAKTQSIAELGKVMKAFATKAANVLIGFVEGLESIVTTGNVPGHEEFEHFEKVYHKLRKFLASDGAKFVRDLDVLIGCPPARQFKAIFKSLDHQVEYIGQALHRIREAVEGGKDKREYVQRQATIISNRVVKLSKIIEDEFAASMVELTTRIDDANEIVTNTLLANSTNQVVEGLLNTTRSALANISISALEVYVAGQLSIRTNLSMSIGQLSVYKKYRALSHLSNEIEESYNHLFHYLYSQNRSDLDHIKQYYDETKLNSVNIIKNTTDTLLDVAQRIILEFVDFFLEGRISETCKTYQMPLLETYEEFTSNITQCLNDEITVWNQTVQAFNCSICQIQSSTNAVAASLAQCAAFANCDPPAPPPEAPATNLKKLPTARALMCIGSPDPTLEALAYAKTKACLKTNLRDMHLLTGILKPQFEHVDRLIKLDVEASEFRLGNCMRTRLNELVAKLKTTRVLFRACMKQIDECPVEEICGEDTAGGKCERKDSGEDSHEKGLLRKVLFVEAASKDE